MDILDIVNENDEVIGQAPRTQCHSNNLMHRIGLVMVFKDKTYNELLLQIRGKHVLYNPGKISIPGGHILSGESYLEGAKRELFEEEFSNHLQNLEFEELFKIKRKEIFKFVTVFRTICSKGFKDQKEESDGHFFMTLDKIIKDIKNNPDKYSEQFREIVKHYIKLEKCSYK